MDKRLISLAAALTALLTLAVPAALGRSTGTNRAAAQPAPDTTLLHSWSSADWLTGNLARLELTAGARALALTGSVADAARDTGDTGLSERFPVAITTGNRSDAGTDADVHIVLFGPDCVIATALLDHARGDDFERGTRDVVSISGAAADLSGIELYHDNSGSGPGWFVDTVEVTRSATGTTSRFPLHRWLATDEGDHAINVYTDGESGVKPLPGSSLAPGLPTVSCDRRSTPRTSELSITSVEVSQGIQMTPSTLIPLIAEKRTFVRAYLKSGDNDVAGVRATLKVAGPSDTVQPLGPTTATARAAGSDPSSSDSSFLFELPRDAVQAGSRQITIALQLPGGRTQAGGDTGQALLNLRRTLTFHLLPTAQTVPTLEVVPLGYTNIRPAVATWLHLPPGARTWPARSPRDFIRPLQVALNMAVNMLPITAINVRLRPAMYVDCGKPGRTKDGAWHCGQGLDAARKRADAAIDHEHPDGGAWIVLLEPDSSGCACGASSGTARGNHRLNFQLIADDPTLAHEMGHSFGAGHSEQRLSDFDPRYPRPDGTLGPYVGISYYHGGPVSLVPGQRPDGTLTYDVMSYRDPQWISPYNYCVTLNGMSRGALRCPNGTDHVATG